MPSWARRCSPTTRSANWKGVGKGSERGRKGVGKGSVRKLTFPNGSYVTNGFDNVGRLVSTILKNCQNVSLNVHSYSNNVGGQATRQTRTDGSYVDYTYDAAGQLLSAKGKESGGTTNRLHEQFSYGYDAAGNLNRRTNNALVQTITVNLRNELTNVTRSGTLTAAGTTTSTATNVTMNSATATLYIDNTFAKDNLTLADGNNTFTGIAQDSLGRKDTNSVTVNLPATVSFQYDSNGNLISDGRRGFDYDDENQLIRVTVTNIWMSEFTYDGKMRRRIRKDLPGRTACGC
jgi:YD repeat-containing protein